ncbi:FAD-dependent oxidoreductase [Bradyrhizobium sp. SYSU BS000235]|uniref:FAD-dependent oxidoreductase n=1 Tax=Bradyrhizobium sp. SYSU BS000235 TaxID=3411332 RepID=UPI003C734961
MNEQTAPEGPDLSKGVKLTELAEGKLLGHVGEEQVLLVRGESGIFAVGAHCTHYHGPLADGLVVGDTIRCPWHHACFNLRNGEAVRAPAFNPIDCWKIEERGDTVFVGDKVDAGSAPAPKSKAGPDKIVIIGGGAAGFAAAEMLRRENFSGELVMLSQEAAAPIDRPNASKDYLAGNAPEDWMPLRPDDYYRDAGINLQLGTEVTAIDPGARQVRLKSGEAVSYGRLLLATGAEPRRLTIPGSDLPHVHTLRTLADSRAIIAAIKDARRAVVIGSSFIGLETAAALRARDIEVHVVAPEKIPMERVLGPDMGQFIRRLHEEHGVIFHLDDGVVAIEKGGTKLKSGGDLQADVVVAGIGVQPRVGLAERAGIKVDRGVLVDRYLETSVPGIYAAGDIARWPDPHSGENIRVEHWVVAERQGQAAARNMLGVSKAFDAVPFFWSQHYDVPINYVGHAERWDEIAVHGDIAAKDCLLEYKLKGRVLAVASIFRDLDSLKVELAMERSKL